MSLIIIIILLLLHIHSLYTQRSATEVAVGRNVSYLGTPPSTASGAQATDTVAGHTPGAATEYSRIGPSYETITNSGRQQSLPSGGNRVSDSLSERYEFSEPHLAAMISAGRSGGTQGNEAAAAMDYEVPLQSGQHEEYSHLQH